MIKLQQLLHALALRRHGNFHRAAEAQHLSQPAFSRSIRNLEEGLGVTLFDRAAAVTPTLYGEALQRRAEAILAEADELEREIRLLQGIESGSFSVAMGAYAAEMSGKQSLAELARQHPRLRCRARLRSWRDVLELVLSRSVDIGIAEISTLRSPSDRLMVEPIGQHRMVFYCRRGHPLTGRVEVSKRDLDAYPLATIRVPPRGASLLPGLWSLDEDTGDLIPHIEVDHLPTAHAAILASDAFGVATPLQIEPWLRSGALVVLPYQAPWLRLDYGFIYRADRMLSPATELFMSIVRAIEAERSSRNGALMAELLPDPTLESGSLDEMT